METAPNNVAHSGPDFLCVGAQKAGTSWLYDQLRAHPDFWMPPVKGLHYFSSRRGLSLARNRRRKLQKNARDDRDVRFLDAMEALSERPEIDFEGYATLFEPKGALISGDITPAYSTLHDEVVECIATRFPRLHVIFLARDPVERVWSQLCMLVRHQTVSPFNPDDVDAVMRNILRPEVLLRSYLSQIVARWRRHIHPTRLHVYFFDDLKREPVKLRQSVMEFLGADSQKLSGDLPADHNQKAQLKKLPLPDEVRSQIVRFFTSELKACAAELGGAAREWLARYEF